MTDTVLVELDPPITTSSRTVPVMWAAIAILLSTAVASALLGVGRDDDRPPAERLAAASDVVTEEDFAFAVSVSSGATADAEFRLLGSFDAETTRVKASFEGLGPDLEFVVDGTTQYIKIPPDAGLGGTTGKPWLRMDLSAFVDPKRSGAASSNPLDTFRQLGAISGPIVRVGEEEVRGEPTVHFRTTVDATKTLPPSRVVASEGLDALRNVPIDVWLDDEDRPRRYRQTLELPFDSKNQKVITTMESFDFGKPVTVDLPPPDQVGEFDASALIPSPAPAG